MFKKGDKVKVVKTNVLTEEFIHVGDYATVLEDSNVEEYVPIQFENEKVRLHDCQGLCEYGYGWNIWGEDIVLLREVAHEENKFTKYDLQSGDIIIHRNGDVGIYIEKFNSIIYKCGYNDIGDYNEDLESTSEGLRDETDEEYDIMKVYRPNEPYQCGLIEPSYKHGDLVYERIESTPMTLAEVCKALGKNIHIVEE